MYNIIKARLQELKRPVNLLVLIGVLIIDIIPLLSVDLWTSGNTASEIVNTWAVSSILLAIYVVIMGASSVGFQDFMDKTINYDILAGHSRAEVYWSRVLVTMGFVVVTTLVICLLPLLLTTAILGWGGFCDLGWLLIRYLLLMLALVRAGSEAILVTVLAGNVLAGAISVYPAMIIGMLGGWLMHFYYPNYSVINGLFWGRAAISLTDFNQKLGFVDGKDKALIDTSVPIEMVVSLVVASVVMTVICLLAGHYIMKKKEL